MGAAVPQATRRGWLTIALAVAIATPATAVAAPTTIPAPRDEGASSKSRGWAHVAVDTSQIGEAGPAIRRRVQERADVVLRRAGVMPGRGPQDPTINVVIREKEGDDPGWDYLITVTHPDRAAPTGTPQLCELCTETELIDAIEGRLATIAAELETQAQVEEPHDDPTAPTDEPVPARDPKRLGPKGKAGAALVALGGSGVIVGIVLAVLPASPATDDGRNDYSREVFTQPPGYALLGVGAAVLVTGAVLLGLDRRQARRRSREQARIRAVPGLGFRF